MFDRLQNADIEAGISRIEAIVAQFDAAVLERAGGHDAAQRARQQPWLVAGVSDGIGLHTVIAAIEAGVLRTGLGVFWEPPHFLELGEDGQPVSPVHWARVQNAAALQEWARRKGADFRVIAADVIMAPERDLKGNAKGPASAFPEEIRVAFEEVRGRTPGKDAIVINSVAFGKWISPREGEEAIAVPTVDFEGRIIEMRTKKYHARGYQETLDTMGRNHGLLLEAVREFGWLGPDALTAFFTWAGGSQNVDVLEGIYGKGALGDAKVIAESDIAAFRLKWGLTLGAHAIVRLPAFLSAALMGIPGGGLFGLISRGYLEERGLFEDMPQLAERMIDRMFGPQWVRENPISQIELDTAETLHIEAISAQVDEAHRRIGAYWDANPDTRAGAIELEQSRKLLAGLAPPSHDKLLRRFDPNAAPETFQTPEPAPTAPTQADPGQSSYAFDLDIEAAGGAEFRPDVSLVRAIEPLQAMLGTKNPLELAVYAEHIEVDPVAWARSTDMHCSMTWKNGGDQIVLTRSFTDASGHEVMRGETVIGPRHERPPTKADPHLLGDAVGPRMPVRVSLATAYQAADELSSVLQGPALIGFARENLKAAGVFDDATPRHWDVRVDGTVRVGDHLLTYARRESDGWVVTVVDDESRPVLQMSLR